MNLSPSSMYVPTVDGPAAAEAMARGIDKMMVAEERRTLRDFACLEAIMARCRRCALDSHGWRRDIAAARISTVASSLAGWPHHDATIPV